jgi:hypothetical protein
LWHKINVPLDCATFYEDRQRPSFCHNALNFRFIQANFSKNPKNLGKKREFYPKKAKNTLHLRLPDKPVFCAKSGTI